MIVAFKFCGAAKMQISTSHTEAKNYFSGANS